VSGKILIIAEQQRLQRLCDGMAEADLRGVTVVTSLIDAADQLEQELPGLILVQDRLSGLSGELIVRHLRKRLRDSDAIIVLATEAADSQVVDNAHLHLLDTSFPDQELVRQLERLVARLPRPQRVETAAPVPVPASLAAEDEFVPLVLPGSENVPVSSPPVGQEPTIPAAAESKAQVVAEIGEALHDMVAAYSPVREPVVASRFEAELETELARHEVPADSHPSVAGSEPTLSVTDLLTVADSAPPRRLSRGLLLLLGGLALLLVLALVVLQMPPSAPQIPPGQKAKKGQQPPVLPVAPKVQTTVSLPPAGPTTTVTPLAVPPAQSVQVPALPKFVRAQNATPDPAYGRDHAGWERYITPVLEFKLFRENGKLQAIQVVDREGRGIPARIFSAAMEELTGVRDYQTESREVKGGYLVKKGRLASGSRIIIYKDRQDEQLHGFVIYFK
jgi:CheY-like chemotaxis protein